MKRDPVLVRELLLWIEENTSWSKPGGYPDPGQQCAFAIDMSKASFLKNIKNETVRHYLEVFRSAGFIFSENSLGCFVIQGLTWEGYNYLDTVRQIPPPPKNTKRGVRQTKL